jgi:hypothetical protein
MLAGNRGSQLEYGEILRLPIQEPARRLIVQFSSSFPASPGLSEIQIFRATIHFPVSFKRR